MKKRIIPILFVLAFFLFACSNNTNNSSEQSKETNHVETSVEDTTITVAIVKYSNRFESIPSVTVTETTPGKETVTEYTFADGEVILSNVSAINNFEFSTPSYVPVDVVFESVENVNKIELGLKRTSVSPAANISGYVTEFNKGLDNIKVWYNQSQFVETDSKGKYEIRPIISPPYNLRYGPAGEYASLMVNERDSAIFVTIDLDGVTIDPDVE